MSIVPAVIFEGSGGHVDVTGGYVDMAIDSPTGIVQTFPFDSEPLEPPDMPTTRPMTDEEVRTLVHNVFH